MTAWHESTMFDPQPGRDYSPGGTRDDRIPLHAHTGSDCAFCATRTGDQAKAAGTKAVTRDEAWWDEAAQWLDHQPIGQRFTADDLVACVGKPTGSANQIGARLRSWAMADLIDPVDVTSAGRAQSHGRLLRVWEVSV